MTDRALADLPVPARDAIAAQLQRFDADDTPCQGLHSYRILSIAEGADWGATDNEICVHFQYIHDDAGEGDPPGLEVTCYAPDGTVTHSQDFG
jgi:hypothetical protein